MVGDKRPARNLSPDIGVLESGITEEMYLEMERRLPMPNPQVATLSV